MSTRGLVKIVASVALAVFFLWSAFHSVDLAAVWDILLGTHVGWLLVATAVIILATYPRAFRWRILMAPVAPGVPIATLFRAILIGYAGNNLVPRAGELAKVWAVDRTPARVSGLIATVAVERLIDLIAVVAMFAAVAWLLRDRLGQVFPWMSGTATTVAYVLFAITAGLVVVSVAGNRVLDRAESRYPRLSGSRLGAIVRSFLQGTESIRSPSAYAGIFFWTLLLNAAYALAMYLPFFAFGFDTRYGLGFVDAIAVLVIATIGIIIPMPGGTGTYHWFCSRALHGLFGVPLEEAVAFATAVHGLTYVAFLVLGGPGLIGLVRKERLSLAD